MKSSVSVLLSVRKYTQILMVINIAAAIIIETQRAF